jgi:DNA-directed RNA polymerase subunit omega
VPREDPKEFALGIAERGGPSEICIVSRTNPLTTRRSTRKVNTLFFKMLAPQLTPSTLAGSVPTILQFPTEAFRPVRSLRNMTTQLLQEAAQVIPNQQLLINVVSKRVRQLGLGHRPMVEVSPRASLSDIALQEIIAGKLTFEPLEGSSDGA